MQLAYFITDVVLIGYNYYYQTPQSIPNRKNNKNQLVPVNTLTSPQVNPTFSENVVNNPPVPTLTTLFIESIPVTTIKKKISRKQFLSLKDLEASSRLIKNALRPELKEIFRKKVDELLETINKSNFSHDIKSEVSRVFANKCSYLNRCFLTDPKNIRESEFLKGVNVLNILVESLFNIETHIEEIRIKTISLIKEKPLPENEINNFVLLMEEHLQMVKNKIIDCKIKNGPKALDDTALIFANRYKSWFDRSQNQNNRPTLSLKR